MFLAAAERPDLILDRLEVKDPTEKWANFPYSCISHHGADCCDLAREWVLAYDFAQLNGGDLRSGPRWLRARYEWGPSEWPIHWCDAVKRKTLDCGALACIAHTIFTDRGQTSFPAQFIQLYSEDATSQWQGKWDEKDVSTHWIDEDVIYHEGTALLTDGDELKLFDPSAGWWLNPRGTGGYGSLVAVRVFDPEGRSFRWGRHEIAANTWVRTDGAD